MSIAHRCDSDGFYSGSSPGRTDLRSGIKPLKPGKYTLYLEAAREHGTYQIIRHPLVLGADPIKETKLKSNAECKAASVEYRPHKAKPAAKDAK